MKAANMKSWRQFATYSAGGATTLALLSVFMSNSSAGDWSVKAKTTEKVFIYDNYLLLQEANDVVVGSLATVGADATYLGHDYRFDILGDVSFKDVFGSGSGDLPHTISPRLQTRFKKKGKTTSLDLNASFAREEVSMVDELDPALGDLSTYRDTTSASAAYSTALDLRNTLGASAGLQKVWFEDRNSQLTPSLMAEVGAYWSHRLTKRTDISTSVSASWLSLDNIESTDRKMVRLRTDLVTQLTPALKLKIGAGARLVSSQERDPSFLGGSDSSIENFGWIGDVGLDYQFKTGSVSAFASKSTSIAAGGDLQDRWTLGLLGTKRINELSELGLSLQYRLADTDLSGSSHVLALSPTYTYKLTDEWKLQAGYRFVYVRDESGKDHSNSVFVALSREWTPLP